MVELYVSWVKGLPESKEALEILRQNNLGVEMSNIDEQVEMVQDAGVKFSAHTPGLNLTLNLAKPDFVNVFEEAQGERLLWVIRNSDAPVVGFHLGYSASHIYKMMAYPNVPTPRTIITNRQTLQEIIVKNLCQSFVEINSTSWEDYELDHKIILIETLDYSRERRIPWDIQLDEAKARKDEIQETVEQYGINAGILHVTEPSFVAGIFKITDAFVNPDRDIPPVEFLFDIAHNFISADAKISRGEFKGSIEDYFNIMLDVVKNRTYQLHLTVPAGDNETGYSDRHQQFTPGERLSDRIMDLTKGVYEKTKRTVGVITLEIKEPEMQPIEHARRMVRQAEYVIKKLNL